MSKSFRDLKQRLSFERSSRLACSLFLFCWKWPDPISLRDVLNLVWRSFSTRYDAAVIDFVPAYRIENEFAVFGPAIPERLAVHDVGRKFADELRREPVEAFGILTLAQTKSFERTGDDRLLDCILGKSNFWYGPGKRREQQTGENSMLHDQRARIAQCRDHLAPVIFASFREDPSIRSIEPCNYPLIKNAVVIELLQVVPTGRAQFINQCRFSD